MSENWMSRLPDDVNVCQLSIPGTHDSHCTAVNCEGILGFLSRPYAVTQAQGVYAQLMAGVRYVDLRVGEGIRMRHGRVELKGNLHDCLEEIRFFLERQPTETVLVHIMWDHEGVGEPDWFTKHVAEQWYQYKWSSDNDWPTLGSVRRRAVLLRRFKPHPSGSTFGIDVNGFNELSSRTASPGKWNSRPMGCENEHDPSDKWAMVWSHLEMTMNSDQNDKVLYITNLAGARIKVVTFNNDEILPGEYAMALNPKLVSSVSGLSGKKRLGVVQMDWITERESSAIWNKNFS